MRPPNSMTPPSFTILVPRSGGGYGVGLRFPGSRYGEVQAFLTSAFGPQPNAAGWGVREIGAAIYLQTNGASTFVGVHPLHFFIVGHTGAATNSVTLVQIDSQKFG